MCIDALHEAGELGLSPEHATIFLETPTCWKPPKGFPPGEVRAFRNGTYARYLNALDVLRWIGDAGMLNRTTEH
jgi:hypothetical protein